MLLRHVRPDRSLGDVFGATQSPPEAHRAGASLAGVKLPGEMDAATQADMQVLWSDISYLPCGYPNSLKCEALLGEGLPTGESAHWRVPGRTEEVAMFRQHGLRHPLKWLWRGGHPRGSWSEMLSDSNFPDIGSKINAGPLPSGAVYMLNNACPKPWRKRKPLRDPLVLSLSQDGLVFTKAMAITSCYNEHLNGCAPRYPGFAKTATADGPAYPQGVTVTGKGPELDGLYVAFTNNKEDVWVVKVSYSELAMDGDEDAVGDIAAESGEHSAAGTTSGFWGSSLACKIGSGLSRLRGIPYQ